jgi:2'-5' RNA ligase
MIEGASRTSGVQRLFFALMPPVDVARRIAAQADTLEIDGRPGDTARLHLTLAFLGKVESHTLDDLFDTAARIDLPRFTLVLDRLGLFRRARIAWFGPSQVPPVLLDLATKLDKNTARAIEKARYRPHVTIRRKIDSVGSGAIEPIEWPVRDFSLVVSGENGHAGAYRELRRWPLS